MSRAGIFTSASLAVALFAAPAAAHPHVWVAVDGQVKLNAAGAIVELQYRWTFDEAFSAFAIQGLDMDGDGNYSREELQPLAKVNAESLSEYGFFTNPVRGIVSIANAFTDPTEYWLDWDGSKLTLNFNLPAVEPIDLSKGAIAVEVLDPSYYIAFDYVKQETMTLVEGAPANCQARLERAASLDAKLAAEMAEYGPDEALPAELLVQTGGLANAVIVSCK